MAAIVTAVVERQNSKRQRRAALNAGGGSRTKLVMSEDDNPSSSSELFGGSSTSSEFQSAVEHSAELDLRHRSAHSRRSTDTYTGDDSDAADDSDDGESSVDSEKAIQDEARRAFASYDDGQKGTLSKASFRRALRHLGRALTQRESDAMFRAIDADGSGAIDETEIEIALSDEFGRMADESTRADVGAASRHEDHAPDGKPHTHMSVSHHHDKDKGHNDKSRAFADTDPYADARAAGYGNTRLALYGLLDGPSPALTPALRRVALVWQVLITLCIITSIVAFLVSTQASFYGRDNEVLAKIEIFVVTVFTVDYLGRLLLTPYPRFMLPYAWRCCKPPRAQASSRDLRTGFVWIFLNIVDLLSVVPFYVELIVAATAGGDSSSSGAFAAVRVLRLFRLARVLKVGRYVAILQIVGETLRRSVVGLGLLVFSVLVAGLLYGSIEFYAENFAGCVFDDKTMLWTYTSSGEPSPFQSVLQGTWWAIVTLTTVGYGDKFPLTWPGQVVAVFAILSGLVVLAFPITIISSNFIDVTAEVKVEADENEAVAKVDLSAIDARFSDMELVNVVKGELRNQADAINKLQETVDEMAFRWRSAEAAIRILERRARRADHQRLRSRRGAAAAAVDIELGARQLK